MHAAGGRGFLPSLAFGFAAGEFAGVLAAVTGLLAAGFISTIR